MQLKRHHFEEAGIINTVLAPEKEIADKARGGWKMGYNLPGHDCIVLIWFCMAPITFQVVHDPTTIADGSLTKRSFLEPFRSLPADLSWMQAATRKHVVNGL